MTSSTWTWKSWYILGVCLWACSVSGCNLLFPETSASPLAKSPLKPVVASRDAIDLEVYFVDRRVGDPLIGDSLWESLHSLSSMEPETRQRLKRDGFRVAMSAARPPRPLQVLMDLSDARDPTRRAVSGRYPVASEGETLITSNVIQGDTVIDRHPLGGPRQSVELKSGLAAFRIQVKKVEEGWSELVIIPEIQHGQNTLQPTATNSTWTLEERRSAIALFEDHFTAELNVGEILVIGMNREMPDSIASQFFRIDEANGLERIMMVRIANIRTIDAERAEPGTF